METNPARPVRRFVINAMVVAVAGLVLSAAPIRAQEGHPLAGTWYGDYGAGTQKSDITVIMKWDGSNVTGSINPGPNSRPVKSVAMTITPGKPAPQGQGSTFGTPPIFHVRIDVDGMMFEGDIQNPVAGNRRITGTWTRGSEKGTFQLRRL